MEHKNLDQIRQRLDAVHQWPSVYMFKFIVPLGKEEEVAKLLPNNEMVIKRSAKGNYVSATVQAMMPSSDAIVAVYKRASEIDGIISL